MTALAIYAAIKGWLQLLNNRLSHIRTARAAMRHGTEV
jgi:hypothetical protein